MKTILFSISLLALSHLAISQPQWVENYDLGRALAAKENKLIVLDFYADWCGPCKKMDKDVWAHDSVVAASQNAIMVKIDLDRNRPLAMQYNVTSIPRTLVIDYKEETLWEKNGYQGLSTILDLLKSLPSDAGGYNQSLMNLTETAGFQEWFTAAQQAQQLAKESPELKHALLQRADKFLDRAIKLTGDSEPALAQQAELMQYYGMLTAERYKKVAKSLAKMEGEIVSENQELYYRLLIAACRRSGDRDAANAYAAKLTALQQPE